MMLDLEVYVLWLVDLASIAFMRGTTTSAQRWAWMTYIAERQKVDYWLKGKR